jgi:hypothetical protein
MEKGKRELLLGDWRTTRGRLTNYYWATDGETGSGEGKLRKGDEKGN